ncbi:uncharacterized protein LOC103570027 [Microplitis demolitor]|uniref:uncharacterized protein LOC103570027 n=1 Tax=Microplitis demolitor TaxID=69319 RepID=UPI0004CDA795|nr:uncharacterized protein LOC103570027 [Microplitis demolitor]
METEEPVEINTDELTEKVSKRRKFEPPILHASLTPACVVGTYRLITRYCELNDTKPFHSFDGIPTGAILSVFIKTILYNPYDRIRGSKYHFIYFARFGKISVTAVSLIALLIFFCTTDEDFTEICGWECPGRQFIYWTAFSYGAGFVLVEVLCWVGYKIEVLYYSMFLHIANYLESLQGQPETSTSSIIIRKLTNALILYDRYCLYYRSLRNKLLRKLFL